MFRAQVGNLLTYRLGLLGIGFDARIFQVVVHHSLRVGAQDDEGEN